jgi:hypothetical protein
MDHQQSRDQSRSAAKRWKHWVDAEVRLLQAALSDVEMTATALSDVSDALSDVTSRAQYVLNAVQTQRQILSSYVTTLPRLRLSDVSGQDVSTSTLNVTITDDDVTVQVNTDALQQRLRDVIDQQRPASLALDVMAIITQLMDLITRLGEFIRVWFTP